MATRAGKAFVDFQGNFSKLQHEATSAITHIGRGAGQAFGRTFGAAASGASQAMALLGGATVGFLGQSTLAAGRVQELNVVLDTLARTNHLSAASVQQAAAAVKGMGIETATAQQTVAAFIQSNLDISKAANLARIAQDAAVISGKNSTETLQGLVEGIQTQQIDVLRQNGIFINGQVALENYAKQLGISVNALSATQKQQAYLNAVMEQGTQIAGAYTAAMDTPSKLLRSFPRLFNDIAVAVGSGFTAAFGAAVKPVYELVKAVDTAVSTNPALKNFFSVAPAVVAPFATAMERATTFVSKLNAQQVGQFSDEIAKLLPLVAPLAAGMAALGATKLPFVGAFLPGINPLLAGFGALVAVTPELRSTFVDLLGTLRPALTLIGSELADALRGLLPVLTQLLRAIAPVLTQLGGAFAIALTQLVPLVVNLVNALAPLIATVGVQFLELLVSLIPPLEQILAAVLPVVQVVGATLLKALIAVMPALTQLADVFADVLAQAVTALAPVLEEIAPILGELLVTAVKALVPVLIALMPSIAVLAKAFAQILVALLPMLPALGKLVEAVAPLLVALAPLVNLLVSLLAPVLVTLTEWTAGLAGVIAGVLTDAVKGAGRVLDAFNTALHRVGDFFSWLGGGIAGKASAALHDIGGAFTKVRDAVTGLPGLLASLPGKVGGALEDAGNAIGGFFASLPGQIGSMLADVGGALGRGIAEWGPKILEQLALMPLYIVAAVPLIVLAIGVLIARAWQEVIGGLSQIALAIGEWAADAIPAAVEAVASFFEALPGRIYAAVTGVVQALARWELELLAWIVSEVPKLIGAVVGFFVQLPGRIATAVADTVSRLETWLGGLIVWAATSLPHLIATIVDFFIGLPGRIVQALAGLGGTLASTAGTALVAMATGFASNVWHVLKDGVWKVSDAIFGWAKGAGDWLINAGVQAIQGLINGMKNKVGELAGFLGGLKDKIVGWKGPPEADRLLLVGNGQLIMGGLLHGLRLQIPALRALLANVADEISKAPMPGLGAGAAGLPYAAASVTGGGKTVIQNFSANVTGSPVMVDEAQLLTMFRRMEALAG